MPVALVVRGMSCILLLLRKVGVSATLRSTSAGEMKDESWLVILRGSPVVIATQTDQTFIQEQGSVVVSGLETLPDLQRSP